MTERVEIHGIQDVNETLKELSLMPKNAVGFRRLAKKASNIIYERTVYGGVDVTGIGFTPYSDEYLEYKEERKGETMSNVDLNDHGNMFAAMLVDGSNKGSRLFFASENEGKKALKHNEGLDGLPQREFFALNTNEVDEQLIPLVESDIDKYMAKI